MRTQTGELSLRVNSWKMLSKTLVELTEERKVSQTTFIEQTEKFSKIRESLILNGFIEVAKQEYLALSVGYDKVFSINDLKINLLWAYRSADDVREFLSKVIDENSSVNLSEIFPDPEMNKEGTPELKRALSFGLPAFTMAEIFISEETSNLGVNNKNEKK